MKTPELPEFFDFAGQVAVVTGGNGGIGRGIALGLAKAGAAVAIFRRNVDKKSRVLSELKALGGLYILVNNAGIVSVSGGMFIQLTKSMNLWGPLCISPPDLPIRNRRDHSGRWRVCHSLIPSPQVHHPFFIKSQVTSPLIPSATQSKAVES